MAAGKRMNQLSKNGETEVSIHLSIFLLQREREGRERMDPEEINKVVSCYLEKMGFTKAGLAFQKEKQLHRKASSTAQIDPDIAKQILSFSKALPFLTSFEEIVEWQPGERMNQLSKNGETELSVERLCSMKKHVFGLGSVVGLLAHHVGDLAGLLPLFLPLFQGMAWPCVSLNCCCPSAGFSC